MNSIRAWPLTGTAGGNGFHAGLSCGFAAARRVFEPIAESGEEGRFFRLRRRVPPESSGRRDHERGTQGPYRRGHARLLVPGVKPIRGSGYPASAGSDSARLNEESDHGAGIPPLRGIQVGSGQADIAKLAAGRSRAVPVVDNDLRAPGFAARFSVRPDHRLVCQPVHELAIHVLHLLWLSPLSGPALSGRALTGRVVPLRTWLRGQSEPVCADRGLMKVPIQETFLRRRWIRKTSPTTNKTPATIRIRVALSILTPSSPISANQPN